MAGTEDGSRFNSWKTIDSVQRNSIITDVVALHFC
jgi:hypothetical protein